MVYAKLGHFRKAKNIFFVFNNSFSYSANLKTTVNKTSLILSTASTEQACSLCVYSDPYDLVTFQCTRKFMHVK